jgi:hypothetical protein
MFHLAPLPEPLASRRKALPALTIRAAAYDAFVAAGEQCDGAARWYEDLAAARSVPKGDPSLSSFHVFFPAGFVLCASVAITVDGLHRRGHPFLQFLALALHPHPRPERQGRDDDERGAQPHHHADASPD